MGLPAGAMAADRLHEAAAAKSFGPESLGIAANLIGEEGFETPAESMPELLDLLSHPVETARGGFVLADNLSGRLGLTGLPEKLMKWGLAKPALSSADLDPGNLESMVTRYLDDVAALEAGMPAIPPGCDINAILTDLEAGGPSAASLSALGGASVGV